MAFCKCAITEIDIAGVGAWLDCKLSDYISVPGSGVTGVILWVKKTGDIYSYGLRKKGSTDARYAVFTGTKSSEAMVGVDENGTFQYYVSHDAANWTIYIIGYTTTGIEFATNATSMAPTSGEWYVKDVSSICAGAIGLIFEVHAGADWTSFGCRPNGSTNSNVGWVVRKNTFLAFCGCDGDQKVELYRADSSVAIYLVGWVMAGAVFYTDHSDVTPATRTEWTDLAALPVGATFGFYEIDTVDVGGKSGGIRENGESVDIHGGILHNWFLAPCDINRVCECFAPSEGTVYCIGYATGAGSAGKRGGNVGISTGGGMIF